MNIRRLAVQTTTWTCLLLGSAALAALVFICGLFFGAQPWNNLTLWRMERALASAAHPPTSSVVESKTVFGSEYTDSWDCNYFVGQLRKTVLSPSDVLSAYRGHTITLFPFTRDLQIQVAFVDEETSLPLGHPVDTWELDVHNRIKGTTQTETYYIVFLFEENRRGLGDARCYETGLGFPGSEVT